MSRSANIDVDDTISHMITEANSNNISPLSLPASLANDFSTSGTDDGVEVELEVDEVEELEEPEVQQGNKLLTGSAISNGGNLRKNPRAKKDIWQYCKIYKEKQYSMLAYCLLCQNDVNYSASHSTSMLERHLSRNHKKEFKLIRMERAEKRIKLDDGKSDKPSRQQASIISYGVSCPYYEEKLIDWLIATYQPILTVQHKSFREMIGRLNKKTPAISGERVRSLIYNKYYDLLLNITSICKGRKYALTTDTWTSRAKTAYTTCIVHLIETNSWKLHHFVLGLHQKEGQSTAVDVVNYTEKMTERYELTYQNSSCITSDTEATMVSAGKLFLQKAQ
jgi:hypothetical protein